MVSLVSNGSETLYSLGATIGAGSSNGNRVDKKKGREGEEEKEEHGWDYY